MFEFFTLLERGLYIGCHLKNEKNTNHHLTGISIWHHGGLPRFVQLFQFSAVSGSIGILTYLFFAMATIEDIKKVVEEEIRPLRSKSFSIEEKFDTLQNLVNFMSTKYDELM